VAFLGFRDMAAHARTMDVPLREGQRAWDVFARYLLVTVIGLALFLAGLGTSVWSYLRHRREHSAHPAP
jgi:hypothetical protein